MNWNKTSAICMEIEISKFLIAGSVSDRFLYETMFALLRNEWTLLRNCKRFPLDSHRFANSQIHDSPFYWNNMWSKTSKLT